MSAESAKARLLLAARQRQFLEVVDRDEAEARFRRHLRLAPLGREAVPLRSARGRVLASDVVAPVAVPGFDRASMDGFAVCAADTVGASPREPRALRVNPEVLTPGLLPRGSVAPGTATVIATGGVMPRGADAVVMVEHTELPDGDEASLEVHHPVAPGDHVAGAGSDIAPGETVLRAGQVLTSREIGSLAAVGMATVEVWRRPRVAILSTGDELVAPGEPATPGAVFDSNGAILAAAAEEQGAEVVAMGIARDDEAVLSERIASALAACDLVILSGGTSKGAGDVAARVVGRLERPGVVVHGAALKPGKPICLAVTDGKPVVILPGFPTSAIFTFHEFVAPVIRAFAGLPPERREAITATLPMQVASVRGRTEYLMVSVVAGEGREPLVYPTGKGSGAVTAFGQADGFIAIGPRTEVVPAGTRVEVTLLGPRWRTDLVVVGSHCVGLDLLLGHLVREGLSVKAIHVGSLGGLAAAKRGECDVAGIHLLDAATGAYNRPYLTDALELVPGYRRLQGIVFRAGDPRFDGRAPEAAVQAALADAGCRMVNRNAGSGTRVLVDRLLAGREPAGYTSQARTHGAVAAAVAQGRADWGVAIENVARAHGLAFLPLQPEHFDFVVPHGRSRRAAVQRFLALLASAPVRAELAALGLTFGE